MTDSPWVLLPGARGKLDDAWALYFVLESASGDGLTFRATVSAFFTALRAVPDAVRTDVLRKLRARKKAGDDVGQHEEAFRRWAKEWQRERRKNGSLSDFVESARDEDLHEGRNRLVFVSTTMTGGGTITTSPGVGFVMASDGSYWLHDAATALEHRRPAVVGELKTVVGFENGPIDHLGQPLADKNPVDLCRIALEYYATKAFEAAQFLS